jgi:protein SCO1
VRFDQRLGERVPLEVSFRDEGGRAVQLGSFFHGRPVILALVYYECPMLCTMVLNGLESCLGILQFDAGREFEVVAVSIDPRDTPELAAAKKATYLERYKRPNAAQGWHFLTGEKQASDRLAQSIGFHAVADPEHRQFAHAAGIVVLTPQGQVARYFFGVEYSPKDLRLALVEASDAKIGNVVDQLLLYCFHYDPATGKYGAAVIGGVRIAGLATVLVIAGFLVAGWRREKRQRASRAATGVF